MERLGKIGDKEPVIISFLINSILLKKIDTG
jgi:hypothetical protein